MKKSTLETIRIFLADCDYDNHEVLAELDKELNKGEEVKARTAATYDAIHDLIVGSLSDTPVTCSELFDAIESELPEGVTKGKVQYALTHLWQDEIVKVEGKPNGYRKA